MRSYCVLYRESYAIPYGEPGDFLFDAPLAFVCQADDADHAEEQCEGAYPGCEIVWMVATANPEEAYEDYYGTSWGFSTD
jgi:hypothetical protein